MVNVVQMVSCETTWKDGFKTWMPNAMRRRMSIQDMIVVKVKLHPLFSRGCYWLIFWTFPVFLRNLWVTQIFFLMEHKFIIVDNMPLTAWGKYTDLNIFFVNIVLGSFWDILSKFYLLYDNCTTCCTIRQLYHCFDRHLAVKVLTTRCHCIWDYKRICLLVVIVVWSCAERYN